MNWNDNTLSPTWPEQGGYKWESKWLLASQQISFATLASQRTTLATNMFNNISKSDIIAFLFAVITANALVPPLSGTYAIQNANSSLLLNLNGGTVPTQTIIEFPITQPIANFPNQVWTYIPGTGNTATLQLVRPSTFLSCTTSPTGSQCTGSPATPAPVWIVEPTVHGGFLLIDSVSGLALTGRGATQQTVFLSVANPSAILEQVWIFIDTSKAITVG
ncbi:hypothetical protein BDP27DRAFT_1424112 [Rhodocollybia butyracea]|uniref:Ricin B lectin domain-containing protein n=1 Tax=Rhodocollybia butyracea TaxID=206335 RepID=A0A9P5U4X4_9AGAR|nr:hypothetical protein BDP27DRAFT_1424112 [Rhodocollybia butyracea]